MIKPRVIDVLRCARDRRHYISAESEADVLRARVTVLSDALE
jgi:hypothetical protein